MSDIQTPSGPTWTPAGVVVAAAVNPDATEQVIIAWSSGYLGAKNGARLPSTERIVILAAGESVVDMQITNWNGGPSGYVLTNKARVWPFGGAIAVGERLQPLKVVPGGKAVAFAMDPLGTGGGYWINAHGEIAKFGNVPAITTTNAEKWVTRFKNPTCVAWSFDWDTKRYLLLDSSGRIVRSPLAAGVPVQASPSSKLVTNKAARHLAYNWATGFGYMLDGFGGIHRIGNSPTDIPPANYWPNWDVARRLLMASWGADDTFRYYVVDNRGALHVKMLSAKPVVEFTDPVGTRPSYQLTTSDAVGTIRLAYGTKVSKGFTHRSTVAQLTTVLDDLLGKGAYDLDDQGATPELDVIINLSKAAEGELLTVRTDTLSTAVLVELVAGADPVLTDTSTPTFGWNYTDAEGDKQGNWELQVWEGPIASITPPDPTGTAQSWVWAASGSSDSTRSVTVTERLEDGATYRAYLRAQERNGLWSAWTWIDFSLNLDLPLVPTAAVAAVRADACIELTLDEDEILADTTNELGATRMWWERRRTDLDTGWEVVRSSGRTLRSSGFIDDFERDDIDELASPWLPQAGTSDISDGIMGIRDGNATALQPSLSSPFNRAVILGGSPILEATAVGDLKDYFVTAGRKRITWTPSDLNLAEGGPTFSHDLGPNNYGTVTTIAATTLGVHDSTTWLEVEGLWKLNGYWAEITTFEGADRAIALFDTGRETGAVRVRATVAPATLSNTGNKTISLALATDVDGSGYWFDWRMNTFTDAYSWQLIYRDSVGAETVEDSGSGSMVEAFADRIISVSAHLDDAGNLNVLVQLSEEAEVFTPIDTVLLSTIAGLTPPGKTFWGFGSKPTNTTPLGSLRFRRVEWADDTISIPDVASSTGVPFVADGQITPMGEAAVVTFDAEPDTLMSVDIPNTLYGTAVIARETVSVNQEVGDPQIAVGGKVLGTIPDLDGFTGRLGFQASGDWFSLFADGVPVRITTAPTPAADVNTTADWTATNATLSSPGATLLVTSTGGLVSVVTDVQAADELTMTAVRFSVTAASPVGARAFIHAYEADGVTLIETFVGPLVQLADGDLVGAKGILPAGTGKVAFGVQLDAAVTVEVVSIAAGQVLAVYAPETDSTSWSISTGTGFGAVRFDSVVSAAASGYSGWGPDYTGDTYDFPTDYKPQAARIVPILSSTDVVVASWNDGNPSDGVDDENSTEQTDAITAAFAWLRCRKRGDFRGAATGTWLEIGSGGYPTSQPLLEASLASFSGSVVGSINTAATLLTLSVPPIAAGEQLYVGVVATHAGGSLEIKWTDGGVQTLTVPVESTSGLSAIGTPKVIAVPLPVNVAAQNVTFKVLAGSVALDWWGIEYAAGETPMICALGYEGSVGTFMVDAAANFDNRVVFTEFSLADYDPANPIGGIYGQLLDAFTPTPDTYLASSLITSPVPSISGRCSLGAGLAAGVEFSSPTVVKTAVSRFVQASYAVPGTLAIVTAKVTNGVTTFVDLVETGVAETATVPVSIEFADYHSGTPGPLCGVMASFAGAYIERVAVGWADAVFRDYEAVPGVTYEYRIRTSTPNGAVFSNPVEIGTATAPVVGYWLKDPLDPSRNMRVLREDDDFSVSRTEEQGVFESPGRSNSIVVGGIVKNESLASMTLSVKDDAVLAALKVLLNSGRTLLFQSPRKAQWYVRFGAEITFTSMLDAIIEGEPLYRVSLPEAEPVDVP